MLRILLSSCWFCNLTVFPFAAFNFATMKSAGTRQNDDDRYFGREIDFATSESFSRYWLEARFTRNYTSSMTESRRPRFNGPLDSMHQFPADLHFFSPLAFILFYYWRRRRSVTVVGPEERDDRAENNARRQLCPLPRYRCEIPWTMKNLHIIISKSALARNSLKLAKNVWSFKTNCIVNLLTLTCIY